MRPRGGGGGGKSYKKGEEGKGADPRAKTDPCSCVRWGKKNEWRLNPESFLKPTWKADNWVLLSRTTEKKKLT